MTYPFDLRQGAILVAAELEGPSGSVFPQLILDTGATTTLLSVNVLTTAGYDPALAPGRLELTTSSDVEYVPEIVLSRLKALGQERASLPVVVHTLPVSAGADGLLGLDFFRDRTLTIDFRTNQITLA